jgi:hypothetical protein
MSSWSKINGINIDDNHDDRLHGLDCMVEIRYEFGDFQSNQFVALEELAFEVGSIDEVSKDHGILAGVMARNAGE